MNLPKDFQPYLVQHLRPEYVTMILEGLQTPSPTSIRLNTRRLPADITVEGKEERVPWCPEGVYLKERPAFTSDPAFHGGGYYVQEASSMFLSHVLRHVVDIPCKLALDLCAAPGGKSTLARSILPDDCLLVCNEPIRNRTHVLSENMQKWGHPHVVVTQAYPSDFSDFIEDFDLIIVDAPCSGEGMFRKEEDAVTGWSPATVKMCAERQRTILADIWSSLKPGGYLIYSTCTFNPEEDEDNVDWMVSTLGAELIPIPVDSSWGIVGDMRMKGQDPHPNEVQCTIVSLTPYAHFLPGRIRGEGFFLSVLRKPGAWQSSLENPDEIEKKLKTFISDFVLQQTQEQSKVSSSKSHVSRSKSPVSRPLSEVLGTAELSLEDAFRYLKGESLILDSTLPRGILDVSYQGLRLGQVNNIGSRANNLYPREWRIRSSYLTPHTIILPSKP